MADLSTVFTGIPFENPFLLASAPPTESESNILRAFEAGWGGVVTKTIGLHPVVNVRGPKTKFLRADNAGSRLSMAKRPDTTLVASWNWELISDKPLDWWVPRLESIKKAWPNRVLVASIMAGSGSDKELEHWQTLTRAVQDAGADAIELNFSCPHMDRVDMGSNVGKDKVLCSVSTQAVKEVARVPVWVKLTPATADIVEEADRHVRRRRRRDLVVEHVPVGPPPRSRDPRVRGQRGRLRLLGRPRRPGDPAPVAREDGADDPGVP